MSQRLKYLINMQYGFALSTKQGKTSDIGSSLKMLYLLSPIKHCMVSCHQSIYKIILTVIIGCHCTLRSKQESDLVEKDTEELSPW